MALHRQQLLTLTPVLLAMKTAVWGLWCSLLQLQCERTWLGSGLGLGSGYGKGLALVALRCQLLTLTRCEPG